MAAVLAASMATAGFMLWKAGAVARELVDPPFYRPQPLERVEATYAALAKGEDGDPGGIWTSEEVGGLHLWTLRRARPAKGIVLLLHGFGDDRWGTSPALKWFPDLDAAIFTYRRRDDALRLGRTAPPVTFGAREHEDVIAMVRHLEGRGWTRKRILLMGRSLGASVGLRAVSRLEAEGGGALGGFIWEGAPISSRDFAERLVRGPKDRAWHVLARPISALAARWAAKRGRYREEETDLLRHVRAPLQTPSLCFMATQDRLAPFPAQNLLADRFVGIRRVQVETWHLNCAPRLGPRYANEIHESTRRWLANIEPVSE